MRRKRGDVRLQENAGSNYEGTVFSPRSREEPPDLHHQYKAGRKVHSWETHVGGLDGLRSGVVGERGGKVNDICADASFLIGLYDERDHFHDRARDHFLRYFPKGNNRLIIPWPIVYEAVSTRMVKNKTGMLLLERDWALLSKQNQLYLLSDLSFRDGIVDECFDELRKPPVHYRRLSAVDRVIRRILSDSNIQITAFLTFNPRDFVDVCKAFRRELLS